MESWSALRRWAALALTLLMMFAAGCYDRVQFKAKDGPASTKVAMAFETDPALIQALTDSMAEQLQNGVGQLQGALGGTNPVEQQQKQLEALGPGLTGRLKGDLTKLKLARPVTDASQADVFLVGSFRAGTYGGVMLEWELQDNKGIVVHAGTTEASFLLNIDEFADQVLAELTTLDIDQYSSEQVAARPANPDKAAPGKGSVDEPRASDTDGGNAWAVIIGIEKYREDLTPASHAEADAKTFAKYVETTFGVPGNHIKLLLGERASKADLSSVFEEWLPRNAVANGGKVYVFFSGHGAPDVETGDAYLVPYDADPAYLKTRGYAVKDLYKSLNGLKGQQTFVFLDACFSGSGGRSVLAEGTRPLVPVKDVAAPSGVVSLAAAQNKQTTGAAPSGDHGLFTYHLLDGLRGGADQDQDGHISLDELSRYVAERVTTDARLQNREQNPTISLPPGASAEKIRLVQGLK
jgi:hypothetical protein